MRTGKRTARLRLGRPRSKRRLASMAVTAPRPGPRRPPPARSAPDPTRRTQPRGRRMPTMSWAWRPRPTSGLKVHERRVPQARTRNPPRCGCQVTPGYGPLPRSSRKTPQASTTSHLCCSRPSRWPGITTGSRGDRAAARLPRAKSRGQATLTCRAFRHGSGKKVRPRQARVLKHDRREPGRRRPRNADVITPASTALETAWHRNLTSRGEEVCAPG